MEMTACDIVEMLKKDIMREKQAIYDYEHLSKLCETAEFRRQMLAIRKQEMLHYDMLQEIYADITGREYTPGEVREYTVTDKCEGLKQAICSELKDSEYYSELACCLPCMRHKEKIIAILDDEKCHARILFKHYQESC